MSKAIDHVSTDEEKDQSYFTYYKQLIHQQGMLQDVARTTIYQNAILRNAAQCFSGKTVMDVGAGSGILSYFAAQAGAKKVFAVEASGVADMIRKMIRQDGPNARLHPIIDVLHSKLEDVDEKERQVDTLISEPIGVLLIHERMLETFIIARDRFLKKTPEAAIFPTTGTIHLCPFTDNQLWLETMNKVRFWENNQFYGVDLSPLRDDAVKEMFGSPVIGAFDQRLLMANETSSVLIDFRTITLDQLRSFEAPLRWTVKWTGIIHGIGGWFDISFIPPMHKQHEQSVTLTLSTSPAHERTHWQHCRFLLDEPLAVNVNDVITGTFKATVNAHRSYDLTMTLQCGTQQRRGAWPLHQQTDYYGTTASYINNEFRPEWIGQYGATASYPNQAMDVQEQ